MRRSIQGKKKGEEWRRKDLVIYDAGNQGIARFRSHDGGGVIVLVEEGRKERRCEGKKKE